MPKFYICTNRLCTRRNADSQRVYDFLLANDWTFTKDVPSADLIVVCTCAATDVTEGDSLYNIALLLRKKAPEAKMVITGCLPAINPEKLAELGDFATVGPRNLEDFDRILEHHASIESISDQGVIVVPDFVRKMDSLFIRLARVARESMSHPAVLKLSAKRALARVRRRKQMGLPSYDIRIGKGCLGNCSYCCVRFAAGKLQSKPMEAVLKEFRTGLDKGYHLLTLVGVDTGCYGMDIGTNIVELLKQIFAIPEEYQLRIDDFNPQWLVRYYEGLLPVWVENRRRFREISMPIQSGSNRILKLMKRPYDIDAVRAKLEDLRQNLPDLRVRTHMIAGFPGETAEDFAASKRLVEEFGFADVTVFEYCDRPRTAAAELDSKLPRNVIVARAYQLTNAFAAK
jgi:threonylcarbamoyladenosine tRNA methylthiotransferase CDKAL1